MSEKVKFEVVLTKEEVSQMALPNSLGKGIAYFERWGYRHWLIGHIEQEPINIPKRYKSQFKREAKGGKGE